MDDLQKYWARNEGMLSDLLARVDALEDVVASMHGASMQRDPSKLPTVVFETSPNLADGVSDGDN